MPNHYFNVICEEMSILGGKIVHIDKNVPTFTDVQQIILENLDKHPNAKWELYPMKIN